MNKATRKRATWKQLTALLNDPTKAKIIESSLNKAEIDGYSNANQLNDAALINDHEAKRYRKIVMESLGEARSLISQLNKINSNA